MKLRQSIVGALLAMVAAVCWGALPVAMKPLLEAVDPSTIVWMRFTVAAAGLWIWMAPQTHRPSRSQLSWRYIILFTVATVGLAENFVAFNASVRYMSAPACQIVAQTGPALLILGSVFVLRESMSATQKIGLAVLVGGFILFFNQHLGDFLRFEGNTLHGVALGVTGATGWAVYGLINKNLLRELSPIEIMRVIYTGSALLIFPLATPSQLLNMNLLQTFCMVFCCANTFVAYGAFTEALARWEAAKVSAVTTMTPIFALLISEAALWIAPDSFPSESLNLLAVIGVFVVVSGAVLTVVGKNLKTLCRSHLHKGHSGGSTE